MKFSYVVITYHSASTVLLLLESIRYQIENYGKEMDFQIILADDGSKDDTCKIMDEWIGLHEALFWRVDRLYSEQNQGTCKNLIQAFKAMKGDYYYLIAGDDMLVRENMFPKYELLKKYDIISNGVLKFNDQQIIRDKKQYLNIALQGIYPARYMRKAVKLGCPIENGCIMRKELLTDTVLKSMEDYILLDDRPRYYQIFKENKNVRCTFELSPILLYRMGDNSVSRAAAGVMSISDKDDERLYKHVESESDHFIEKLQIRIQRRSLQYRSRTGIMRMLRYATPYYFELFLLSVLHYRKIHRLENQLLREYADGNEKHMKLIEEKVAKR